MAKDRRPKVDESDPVANLAREALRGFFGDGEGFKDMTTGPRKAAVERLRRALQAAHWTRSLVPDPNDSV